MIMGLVLVVVGGVLLLVELGVQYSDVCRTNMCVFGGGGRARECVCVCVDHARAAPRRLTQPFAAGHTCHSKHFSQ